MSEASEWERWEAIVIPVLEASPSLSEPEIGGLTEQIVDGIVQQTRVDRERIGCLERDIATVRSMLRIECAEYVEFDSPDESLPDVIKKYLLWQARGLKREAQRREEIIQIENVALTASLRAANATTRAAQSRADRAEAALRQRNEP